MIAEYTLNDTANGKCEGGTLHQALLDAGVPVEFISVDYGTEEIRISLTRNLTGGELSSLNTILSSHSG